MAKRKHPDAAPGETEAERTGMEKILREARERAQRKREASDREYEATWAELRAAVARGEITREEILSGYTAAPIRVSVGDSNFEISITASIRDVPAPEAAPTRPAAVLPFRPKDAKPRASATAASSRRSQ